MVPHRTARDEAMIDDIDRKHLQRCVELAAQALEAGDQPYGSVLVSSDGKVLLEERNHVSGGDHTQHPEFAIARWAAQNMQPEERASATVYTSGEHCPMCSAAHGWVGLGRIVYASSAQQTTQWLDELGVPASPIHPLPIGAVVKNIETIGPVEEFAQQIYELQKAYYTG